jgi:hypothetical protein
MKHRETRYDNRLACMYVIRTLYGQLHEQSILNHHIVGRLPQEERGHCAL